MTSRQLRILGLTTERVTNFKSQPTAKSAGLYAALDRRFDVVGIVRPSLPRSEYYFNKLRHIHPDRDIWRQRASLNPWVFNRRSGIAEKQLQQWEGRYDLIMQLHTLVAPGRRKREQPYVLHTDNTYMLSERYYPVWAPLRSQRDRTERIRLEQTTFHNAAFLFPRSEWLRRSLIDDYGCDPKQVIRVGGGANFIATALDGKQYDSQIALFVGNDFERKGGMILLEAWKHVRKQCPEAQLWVVGPSKSRVPSQSGVHWLGQIGDRQVLADLYARASLFVLPSLFEPWGHVVLEAMGHGLACIGSNQFGMPDMIEHDKTGLLVPRGEHLPLADAIIELLSQPQRLAQMGQHAYESVIREQTWDHVIERMVPYIESLATASRPVGYV